MTHIIPMPNNKNPLIQDDPRDTLHQAHCMLLLLEELHASSDAQSLLDEGINMGVYGLLQCANQALAYELERMHQ